jgi:GT2 family glycosyltransferase
MTSPATFTVIIPTYQRPDWIRRAVQSLAVQGRPPDEVIAVARDTDLPTHEAIASLQRSSLPFLLRRELVTDPGFMPPVKRGLAVADADVIAVMDDDAEATDGWSERMLAHYAIPEVGAVGGRVINMDGEKLSWVRETSRVGYVSPVGNFVGEMYCRTTFTEPVEVWFLMGGNMSFRREVAKRIEFDMELNRNVAQGYEVDIGLQVRAMGWKIVFDPLLAIRHYTAPRAVVGVRATDAEGIQWSSFNHVRVALRRLPTSRRAACLAYQLAIGHRHAPGLLPFIAGPLARRFGFATSVAGAALKGRLLAVKSVLRPS